MGMECSLCNNSPQGTPNSTGYSWAVLLLKKLSKNLMSIAVAHCNIASLLPMPLLTSRKGLNKS